MHGIALLLQQQDIDQHVSGLNEEYIVGILFFAFRLSNLILVIRIVQRVFIQKFRLFVIVLQRCQQLFAQCLAPFIFDAQVFAVLCSMV